MHLISAFINAGLPAKYDLPTKDKQKKITINARSIIVGKKNIASYVSNLITSKKN